MLQYISAHLTLPATRLLALQIVKVIYTQSMPKSLLALIALVERMQILLERIRHPHDGPDMRFLQADSAFRVAVILDFCERDGGLHGYQVALASH